MRSCFRSTRRLPHDGAGRSRQGRAADPHGLDWTAKYPSIAAAIGVLPAQAAYLDGEFGYKDLFMGVPVVVGGKGVEKIVLIPLTDEEKGMLAKSAESVQSVVDVVKKS